MNRADFTDTTRRLIRESVGLNCVYPLCAQPTHVITAGRSKMIALGQASHASGASPAGPRGDENLTREQLRALENGANLCVLHATLVDRDWTHFTVSQIQQWQRDAETTRQDPAYHPGPYQAIDPVLMDTRLRAFLRLCGDLPWIHPGSDPEYVALDARALEAIRGALGACRWPPPLDPEGSRPATTWNLSNPYHGIDPRYAALQLMILRHMAALDRELGDRGRWEFSDGVCRIHRGYFAFTFDVAAREANRSAAHQIMMAAARLMGYLAGDRARLHEGLLALPGRDYIAAPPPA